MTASPPRQSASKNRKHRASSNTNIAKVAAPSIGQAIQDATTTKELLAVAKTLWLPTDENLAPHFRTQRIHHEKRQRWSSQLLHKLGCSSTCGIVDWENNDALARAVLAAAIPFDDKDLPGREGRHLRDALWGLHAAAGKSHLTGEQEVHIDICTGIATMIRRIEGMANGVSLPEAVEMRWAARGLLCRIGANRILGKTASDADVDAQEILELAIPNLERRTSALPFDIVPLGVDWSNLVQDKEEITTTLRDAIPFQFDTIVTRSGSSVTERRGTAWVTEDGIGALAYSGKLMPPRPIPNVVRDTMRLVEEHTFSSDLDVGPYFDCALCNHYPHGEAACKFHTDPEHGLVWERLTCVVAAGDERRFAFRPIPGTSSWSKWDSLSDKNTEETRPAVIHLFPGDIVKMWGVCNDCFHHAVYTAEHETGKGDGRVSLVLKRAISRGGGKRGHGLEGRGRRARRRCHAR